MTYHDNKIKFVVIQKGYSLVYSQFIVNDFLITAGEDPKEYIHRGLLVYGNFGGPLNFRIGRHLSTTVANWFNARIPPNQNTFGHTAGELNFALIGRLALTIDGDNKTNMFSFDDVALAQGRSGSTNNWWFGGMNFYTLPMNSVSGSPNWPDGDYFFRFYRGENKVDHVNIEFQKI